MKKWGTQLLIHGFALSHAVTVALCARAGLPDTLFLTVLTMAMAIVICYREQLTVQVTIVSLVLVNVLGFVLGNLGAQVVFEDYPPIWQHVYSKKRRWLGAGFLNDHSKIMVRLISQNANDSFDAAFFRRRLRHAVDFRAAVMGDDFDACRLIFGEADFFPGWTVDRYGDILVSEVLSCGIDCRRELLYSLLLEVLAERGVKIRAVYERNEAALRDKEGLPKYKGFLDLPGLASDLSGHAEICENGIYYEVD